MQWLNKIVDDLVARRPEGEILIESGASPSGTYHIGHLRELLTADAILLELRRRGRKARHIQFVDDFDALRKIPYNVPAEFEQYLGKPLCDIPAPDGSQGSYAGYFLQGLKDACKSLGVEVEYVHAAERYRAGWYVPAFEKVIPKLAQVRAVLENVSGRSLNEDWTPVQIMQPDGRLKTSRIVGIDEKAKTLTYRIGEETKTALYAAGEAKLDWRVDWPGRWWLLAVDCEPSGRDHMTKGSSYDTGVQIMRAVYEAEPPYPVAYDFINMAGDTKKMSASKGTGLDALAAAHLMPPEVVRFFVLRSPALKRLYFDPVNGVVQLMDEFAALAAKSDRNASEEQLLYIATRGTNQPVVSRVPFSLLVASYQAALKDPIRTLEIVSRTEYKQLAQEDAAIIQRELKFIDNWLKTQAPEEVKFELIKKVDPSGFTDQQKDFLMSLATKIVNAPADADGNWFHQAIYDLKDESGLPPKEMFVALYLALIGKSSGPRAGWFLSALPRDWLIKRLKFEV